MDASPADVLRDIHAVPVSNLLSRTLRLARRLGAADLERWVRLELEGYFNTNAALRESDVVPPYRTVVGRYYDSYGRLFQITDPDLQFVNEYRLRTGADELEAYLERGGYITIQDLNFTELLRTKLKVDVDRFRFDTTQLRGILTAIRNELGDRLDALPSAQSVAPASIGLLPAPQLADEIIVLRPNLWGVGLNLRAAWRRLVSWLRNRHTAG
jgi:hypothetical protein